MSYTIKDLETGNSIIYYSPLELFEECKEEFLANDWTHKELKEFEKMFSSMPFKEKMEWLKREFNYEVDF